jgi:hypothetical protein
MLPGYPRRQFKDDGCKRCISNWQTDSVVECYHAHAVLTLPVTALILYNSSFKTHLEVAMNDRLGVHERQTSGDAEDEVQQEIVGELGHAFSESCLVLPLAVGVHVQGIDAKFRDDTHELLPPLTDEGDADEAWVRGGGVVGVRRGER